MSGSELVRGSSKRKDIQPRWHALHHGQGRITLVIEFRNLANPVLDIGIRRRGNSSEGLLQASYSSTYRAQPVIQIILCPNLSLVHTPAKFWRY